MRWIAALLLAFAATAHGYDQRWPDFGVVAIERGSSGQASYFQGFESPCFGPPYQPGTGEIDWVRYYSEVNRVPSGTNGISSRNGLNHAQLLPPLPGAPGTNSGAYTRLGGYRLNFGAGFIVEQDVYIDLTDPRVTSGVNANYGWDAAAAVNNQVGAHRRDFIFHAANNVAGQVLIGSSNTTTFAPRGDLASGSHFVVASSGWYTLRWVFRDGGVGTLAVDTELRSSANALLWTRTLNDASDVIATQIGGNRYLWFIFADSNRLPLDNVRLNSPVREALYASTPAPGATLNAGFANIGDPATGTSLTLQSQGTLRLEVCSCAISGPAAADFSIATCPALVEPNNALTLILSCRPTAAGARTAMLTVVTNDSTRGTNFDYSLLCNGIDPNAPLAAVPTLDREALWLLLIALTMIGLRFISRR